MAYLICRAGRAFGVACTLMWIPFVLELIYVPKTWPLISIIPLALLTAILYFKQIWSLVIMRIIYRALIITVIVVIILALIAWALDALNIYAYNGTAVVAIGLIIGLILTIVSLIASKINGNTFDYRGERPELDMQ